MTKRLAISAAQITAICKGAAEAGFVAEVVIDGVVVRLLPETHATVLKTVDDDIVVRF
ncbi:hypothetical protein [Aliihoeflea sp. PC F10.4]